jgi:hypothetical protein
MEVNFESGKIRREELEPPKRQLQKMFPERNDSMACFASFVIQSMSRDQLRLLGPETERVLDLCA